MVQQSLPIPVATDGRTPLARSALTHAATLPLLILGAIAVIGGGLASAAFAGHPTLHSSWAVAYVVLIPGVAQIVLGVAQTSVTGGTARRRAVVTEALCWNLGAVATVVGTVLTIVPVLYVGAVLQVIALVVFLVATRRGRRGATLVLLRVVSVLLLVSVPTGIVLQALLH